MASKKYDDLSKEELVRLLESRDRRDATRFGLVWEANEIERDRALNQDFVALDLDPALSCPSSPSPSTGPVDLIPTRKENKNAGLVDSLAYHANRLNLIALFYFPESSHPPAVSTSGSTS